MGKLGLVLMGWSMISKSLIQFSVDGWGYVPSLLFDPRQNYGGGNEDNGNLLQKVPCMHSYTQSSQLRESVPRQIDKKSMVPKERTQPQPSTENWIKDLLIMAPPIRTRPSSASVSLSLQEASISLLFLSIRGQTECNHNHRKLTKPITWTTALSNSMKL